MNSMNRMFNAIRGASSQQKEATASESAEEASANGFAKGDRVSSESALSGSSTPPLDRSNSMTTCDPPRINTMALPSVSLSFLVAADHASSPPPRSPKSQAAIEKCMAAIEECKAVLAQSGSSDPFLYELALHAGPALGGSPTAAGSSRVSPKKPPHILSGRERALGLKNQGESASKEDMHRWLEDVTTDRAPPAYRTAPAPAATSWVVEAMRDASSQGGSPKVYRKSPYFRRPTPSPEMLFEVEARGC